MMRLYFLFILIFISRAIFAQPATEISIEKCYQLATGNSPLYQQKALTIAAGNKTEKNLGLKWLPQLDFNAQATYQSDVTSLPIKIPNVTIEALDKDQYKGTLDLVQPVYDGGVISGQKKLQKNITATEAQRVEVDLYQLKTTINSWFFTALLMDENIQLTNLVQQDLENSIKKVTAQVANGTATKSNSDQLKAELLKTVQQKIEFNSAKKQAMEILAILTGVPLNENTKLTMPGATYTAADTLVVRPELKLFEFQQQGLQFQTKLIKARTNPKFSLFANGGYGKPGLNLLKNEFQWFYISGVKLNVPIIGRYVQQKDRDVLKIQEQVVSRQKENFLRNNQQLIARQKNEIEKYERLVATDSEIINLRNSIKETSAVKLSNGIITTNDYLIDLNAASQAMLNQKVHEITLLQSKFNYKIILGQ